MSILDFGAPWGWPTYRLHQQLIGLRRRHPWLHEARTAPLAVHNRRAVLESTNGDHRILLALNLDDEPAELPVPDATHVLAGNGEPHHAGHEGAHVTVPAHGWGVLGL
jgi:cyclomaltodextrinase